jgi:hypothetical protein
MRTAHRPRRYLSSPTLVVSRPFFRYSVTRDAYVLRFVGNKRGPVLRRDRRRTNREFVGPDRRQALA